MRKMGIGLGVGINRSNYAQGIFNAYSARVVADGGVVEAGNCVNAVSSLLQSASLLLIPSGYKGGKLYSEIPTNGNGDLTWTRASDAWRTNADGLIQRVPWNLLSYSEEFSNAYWNKITSTITANTTTAPNGTLTADTLSVTTSTYSGLGRAITGVSANYNLSIYAKKNTKSWLYLIDVLGTGARAWFDLDNGVLGTVANGYTATITNVGDGWYRCTLSNNNAQTLAYYQLGLADANNGITPTSSGSVFIWGAQLVEGTTAQTYLPTTDRLNFSRLSYMYGSCPSALLEPQRTNMALWSEDFSQTTWAKTRCSITANSTTAPDGNTTADTLVEDTTATSTHPVSQAVTLTAAAQTFSIYAKAANRNWIQLTLLSTANASAYFNLSNGTVGTIGSATTASIVSVGNGWYRCVITATTAAGANTLGIYPASADATNVYTGNGTASIYIWGAQCEVGAYATTIIPTTTASATRVADSAVKTGISSIINSQQGTLYVNCRALFNGGSFRGISISDGTYSNRLAIVQSSTANTLLIALVIGNTFIVNQSISSYTQTNFNKVAVSWGSGTLKVFINGSLSNTFTSITMPSANLFTRIGFDAGASASEFEGFIQQMALFPSALTDAQCQTLTT